MNFEFGIYVLDHNGKLYEIRNSAKDFRTFRDTSILRHKKLFSAIEEKLPLKDVYLIINRRLTKVIMRTVGLNEIKRLDNPDISLSKYRHKVFKDVLGISNYKGIYFLQKYPQFGNVYAFYNETDLINGLLLGIR